MPEQHVAVLGGGNTAFSVAACLALRGIGITLYEIPGFEETLAPISGTGTIQLEGVAGQGPARIQRLTTDAAEAVAASDLLLLIVPAYAHKPFAEVFAPHLGAGQTVVLMPGTLGVLEWSKVLREAGTEGVILAEVDTAPYVCRKTAPDTATIWGVVDGLGLGVLPGTETEGVRKRLDPLFPGITPYADAMACGLAAMNPVVHPAGVLMNAGRVEYSRGEFYFYEEGVTPTVAKVIMQVDAERRAVARALGHDLCPADDAFYRAGFGPKGDLWATINGSWMLTRLRAPGTLESRWLTEDIPYGLAAWSSVGGQFGVQTPTMRAFVDIGSIVMGFDAWEAARGVEALGIAGMDLQALGAFLTSGEVA
jgi:opine dehydrogenase